MDDIILAHARVYNPQQAHEYYMRTRHLKGRTVGSKVVPVSGDRPTHDHPTTKTAKELKRQAEVHLADLQNRLDQLRFHLEQLVKDAKKRSGIDTSGSSTSGSKSSTSPSSSSSKSSTTSKSSSSSSSSGSSTKSSSAPLTPQQKQKKAIKDHQWYEKNKPHTVQSEIAMVTERIKKVRAELKTAVENARRHAESKTKAA